MTGRSPLWSGQRRACPCTLGSSWASNVAWRMMAAGSLMVVGSVWQPKETLDSCVLIFESKPPDAPSYPEEGKSPFIGAEHDRAGRRPLSPQTCASAAPEPVTPPISGRAAAPPSSTSRDRGCPSRHAWPSCCCRRRRRRRAAAAAAPCGPTWRTCARSRS